MEPSCEGRFHGVMPYFAMESRPTRGACDAWSRARFVLGVGVFLAIPYASEGQARADRARASVTWDDEAVVARAVERAPDVVRARSALAEALTLAVNARVPLVGNPALGVRAMVGAPDAPAATYALLVGVPIDVSGARGRWSEEARWAAREAEARVDVARAEARASALDAWSALLVAEESVSVAEARLDAARALRAVVEVRFANQAATALDAALSERELGESESELHAAHRARASAQGQLREVLLLAPDERVTVPPPRAPSIPSGLTRERAVALAATRRRELSAHEFATRRWRASSTRLLHESTPPLFVAAEVEWQGYSQASVGASATWSLPISHTRQPERAAADAQARSEQSARDLALHAASHEAARAFTDLELALAELDALTARALPAAERVASLTEQLFAQGAADAARVLRARQDLHALRARRLAALREAWRARVALDRATAGSIAGSNA
jgi:cobalt-zinc-cadmium efflux system outer membrane protein